MRRAIVVAVLSVMAIAAPADAGVELDPSSYTLLTGTQQSADPLTALANNDNTYSDVLAKNSGGKRRVVFKVTYEGVPGSPLSFGPRANVKTSSGAACNLRLFLYNFKMRRFDSIGGTITITDVEVDTGSITERTGRYIRNGKTKAKHVCTSDEDFSLLTDAAPLKI